MFYPHPKDTLNLLHVLIALFILMIITALVIWKIRSKPYLAVGWFWFIGTLVPVIGLCQVGMQAWANRYTYVPYIGLFIALTWWLSDLSAKLPHKKIILSVLAGLILLALGVRTYVQALFWNNDVLLYSYSIKTTKNNWFAHYMLGYSFSLSGDYKSAIDQLEKSVEINPDNADALSELAQAYLITGEVNKAQTIYNRMLVPKSQDEITKHKRVILRECDYARIKELYVSSALNMANIHIQKGNLDEAEKWFKEALQVLPDSQKAKEGLEQIRILRNNRSTDANGQK
jgi:tetratricopeptide (TPR) repeat protein